MSRSATQKTVEDLSRRLAKEEKAHQETRRLLQAEKSRYLWLTPTWLKQLMDTYPSLRKFLYILVQAAELQDPARGAPIEDTMRTQFIHTGANASTSHTEASVSSHARARGNVELINSETAWMYKHFTKILGDKTRLLARLIGSDEWEYELPDKPVCWRKTTDKDGKVTWECPARGRQQPYSAWHEGCVGCGRVFELEETG